MIIEFDEIEDAYGHGHLVIKTGQSFAHAEQRVPLPISAINILAGHKRDRERVDMYKREVLDNAAKGEKLHDIVLLEKKPLLDQIAALSRQVCETLTRPNQYNDVAAFHEKFGVPSHLDTPLGLPTKDVWEFRRKFLREELDEADLSYEDGNFQKFLDALLDLVYVAYGTALMAGVSPDLWAALWQTVQEANMAKVRALSANQSLAATGRGSHYDVIKPEGWVSPDEKQRKLISDALVKEINDN